jgi:hypothetical protein
MNPSLTTLFALLTLAIGLSACTERRPYQEINKKNMRILEKKSTCINDEFLFRPSVIEAPSDSPSVPQIMGETKIVTFKCAESALEARASNGAKKEDASVLFSIPIRHVDFQCAEDPNGACLNKEEEKKGAPGALRFIELKPEAVGLTDMQWLPTGYLEKFAKCMVPDQKRLLETKFNSDTINLIFEQSFKADTSCAGGPAASPQDFKVRFQYSIIRRSKVVTSSYVPLEANGSDPARQAFFTNQTRRNFPQAGNSVGDGALALIERYHPLKSIELQLSANLADTENGFWAKLIGDAIATVNESLSQSGASVRLAFSTSQAKVTKGDLRLNSIVLDQDRLKSGVITAGVASADPKTGEIFGSRINIGQGSLIELVKAAYGQAQAKASQEVAPATVAIAIAVAPAGHESTLDQALKLNGFLMADQIENRAELEPLLVSLVTQMQNRPWASLSTEEQREIIKSAANVIVLPGLVKALGHSLGLRLTLTAENSSILNSGYGTSER